MPPPDLSDLTATLEPEAGVGAARPGAIDVEDARRPPIDIAPAMSRLDDDDDDDRPRGDDPSRYELVGEHARGGLGRVVRALDRRLGRTVAVKELHARSPRAEARFLREALITARLEHPGIVPVHEAGRWPSGEPYYVMKFVSGRTLKAAIGELPSWRARLALLPHVIAVADAVGYAHSQGIIHRDLKPSNVVVGEFGETVVVDWGLARDLRGAIEEPPLEPDAPAPASSSAPAARPLGSVQDATATNGVVGTPAYMAPEQARGEPVDARADVYALGALLYETLIGAPPYAGTSAGAVLAAVQAGPPAPLVGVAPGLPDDLIAIVEKAMARAPEDRYADARGIASDLRRFHTGGLVLAHRYGVGERLARFVARHRAVVAAALIGAVALLAVGALALRRVVSERNVARSERSRALTAQQAAEARQHELVKVQARTSLTRDPTATVAWLKTYQAASPDEAREQAALLDEAVAAGVSRHVWRQTDWVQDAVFSPDGASIASASADGLVRIYDVASGGERVLGQVAGVVQVVSWAPDGASVVCGTAGGELLRWVVRPGASAIPVAPGDDQLAAASSIGPGLSAPIARLTWTGDGAELLVELERTPPVRLRVADGARARPLPLGMPDDASAEVVHGGGAAPGSWRLVWGGRDGKVVTVVGDGAPLTLMHRPGRIIGALTIDEAGQRLAVHDGAQVWVVPLGGGAPVAIGAYSQPAAWLTFSPGGDRLAIGGDDHAITVWTLGAGTPAGAVPARPYRGHTDAVYGVSFARDGARMVSASDDGTARVWDLVTGDVQVLRGHADDVFRARLSPDETRVVTASIDGSVRLWPLAGGARTVLGPEPAGIMRAVLIDDDRLAVAGPGFAARWQLGAGVRTPLFADHDRNDRLALVAPAGDVAVTINDDLSLQLWPERGPARTLSWPAELPVDGAFVDGGKAIMLLTRSGAVWSFDVATGTSAELLPASATASRARASAADDQVVAAAFSDDGAAVFARGETMYRWDRTRGLRTVATGTRGCVRELKFGGRGDQVLAWTCTKQFWLHRDGAAPLPLDAPLGDKPVFIAWSPDGGMVAAALANRTALVWDAHTGALERTLRGHTDLIMSVAFSASGQRVVTGSYDRTMRVWDLGTGDVHVLRGHSASVDFVAWRRADEEIVSAGRDGTIRVWAAPRDAAGAAALAGALDAATSATLGDDDVLATPAVDGAGLTLRGAR